MALRVVTPRKYFPSDVIRIYIYYDSSSLEDTVYEGRPDSQTRLSTANAPFKLSIANIILYSARHGARSKLLQSWALS